MPHYIHICRKVKQYVANWQGWGNIYTLFTIGRCRQGSQVALVVKNLPMQET